MFSFLSHSLEVLPFSPRFNIFVFLGSDLGINVFLAFPQYGGFNFLPPVQYICICVCNCNCNCILISICICIWNCNHILRFKFVDICLLSFPQKMEVFYLPPLGSIYLHLCLCLYLHLHLHF